MPGIYTLIQGKLTFWRKSRKVETVDKTDFIPLNAGWNIWLQLNSIFLDEEGYLLKLYQSLDEQEVELASGKIIKIWLYPLHILLTVWEFSLDGREDILWRCTISFWKHGMNLLLNTNSIVHSTFYIKVNFFSYSSTVSSNQMRGEYFYPVPASNLMTPVQVCCSKTILLPIIGQSLM